MTTTTTKTTDLQQVCERIGREIKDAIEHLNDITVATEIYGGAYHVKVVFPKYAVISNIEIGKTAAIADASENMAGWYIHSFDDVNTLTIIVKDKAGIIADRIYKQIMSEQFGKFWVQIRPDDSLTQFNSDDKHFAERIVKSLPEKYQGKLVGLERKDKNTYYPVFDEETQREWDEALDKHYAAKAAWCERYGCD
jgi:hypothetical protein